MSFFEWTDIIATSAIITTVVQFLSGTVICKKYMDKKSTGDTSCLPFISGFLSCVMWLKYGLITQEESIVLVNSIGAALFFIYTVIYYLLTINKRLTLRQFGCACLIIAGISIFTNYNDNYTLVSFVLGIMCCVVTLMFISAPLSLLVHVIRVKSTESLPFPLIIMSFFVSLLWLIYGIIITDIFIQITNFLGCIISAAQLLLFIIYPSRSVLLGTGPAYKLLQQEF